MKTQVTLDATHRVVVTKEMRAAAGIKSGQTLEVSALPGVIIFSAPHVNTRLVKKGKLKMIDGPLPEIDLAEAVNQARHYTR